MTITERAAKVLHEIDAELAWMENEVTAEPWQSDPEDGVYNASIRCGRTEPWTGDCVASVLKEHDATFIAASRTGWPKALLGLKTAIEGMLEINKYDSGNGCCTYGCDTPTVAEMRLSTLLDQWEASRK